MGKVIAIFNQKGGVGKTTVNINLAAALGKQNKKILIIDSDPQGNCTSGLGIDKEKFEKSIYELLIQDDMSYLEIIDTVIQTEYENISIIPTDINLAGAELELTGISHREHRLKNILKSVKDDYDYVLIDCPPSLGLLSINALVAAESVIIPIQCEYYALEGVSLLMNTLNKIRQNINSKLYIEGVLLTMSDARTNISIEVEENVREYFKEKVYKTVIPRNVRVAEAPGYGMPVTSYDSKSKGSLAFFMLAKEFIGKNKKI